MTMDKLAETAVIAALRGGGRIMSVYCDPDADFQIERKADNSPLTIADRKADEAIGALLKPTGVPILSEEVAAAPYEERAAWRRLWIVDPLDGTKEFIGRRDDFTVNIALVEDGVPVLGVVYLPVFKTLYFALCGVGSFRVSGIEPHESLTIGELTARGERLPLPGGSRPYTCVASVSHMNDLTRLFLDTPTLKRYRAEAPSRYVLWPKAAPTSIRALPPPWSGTPPPVTPWPSWPDAMSLKQTARRP